MTIARTFGLSMIALLAACAATTDDTASETQAICVGPDCNIHHFCYAVTDVCSDLGGCSIEGQKSTNGHLKNPRIIRVYWGNPDIAYHETMWSTIAPSSAFWSRISEYGTGTGTDGGGFAFTKPTFSDSIVDPGVTWIQDGDIQTWIAANFPWVVLESEFDAINLPLNATDHSTIIMVYLAPGTCNAWSSSCGSVYHNSFYDSASKNLYVYAVIDPGGTRDGNDAGATHELIEAATDYDLGGATGCDGHAGGCGWNIEGAYEGELCDLCETDPWVAVSGYQTAPVWSAANCSCD